MFSVTCVVWLWLTLTFHFQPLSNSTQYISSSYWHSYHVCNAFLFLSGIQNQAGKSHLTIPIIAGIAGGVTACLLILISFIVYLVKRCRKRRTNSTAVPRTVLTLFWYVLHKLTKLLMTYTCFSNDFHWNITFAYSHFYVSVMGLTENS